MQSLNKVEKEVYKLGGVDFEKLYEYIDDYFDPSKGSVSGLIYYSDTLPFAQDWWLEIGEALKELGHTERISPNEMTWAIWEIMMGKLECFKEEINIEDYLED